jgi:hypothetical protein
MTDLALPTSYAVADIQDPAKRSTNLTKTVQIPSTKEVNELFEYCFDLNVNLSTFNANLKTPVIYYLNSTETLRGNLKLSKIVIDANDNVIYECNIIGTSTELFFAIGEKYLTGNDNPADDLDFSAYDHVLNRANQIASWATTPGSGYVYPLADYGYDNGDSTQYHVRYLRPALFLKEYIDKIFAGAGKTYTSSFLTSNFFKRLTIPGTRDIEIPEADRLNQETYAGMVAPGPSANIQRGLTFSLGTWDTGGANTDVVLFTDRTTSPFHDAGVQYNTGTGVMTIGVTGTYKIQSDLFWDMSIQPPPSPYQVVNLDYSFYFALQQNSGGWSDVLTTATYSGNSTTSLISFDFSTITLTAACAAGAQYRVVLNWNVFNVIIEDSTLPGNYMVSGSVTADAGFYAPGEILLAPGAGTGFSATLSSLLIDEGNNLEVNQTMPQGVKQRDLMSGVINAFNLQIEPDSTNKDNYIIEPFDDFYTTNYVDWTDKLDVSKGREIIPQGALDFKRLYLSYKSDADYFNKTYEDAWKQTYGTQQLTVNSDFLTNDRRIEVPFSPTPLVGNDDNSLIVPKIYKNEGGVISSLKCNMRLWYWGGLKTLTRGYWTYKSSLLGDTVKTDYPYAGHLDDPYTPTLDLSFGTPREVYYSYSPLPTTYTANNLFYLYRQGQVDIITNVNSAILKAYFNLNEVDINQFSFRNKVYIRGKYYYVLTIKDFDILDPKTTLVELLK